jgi:hypothetical protein
MRVSRRPLILQLVPLVAISTIVAAIAWPERLNYLFKCFPAEQLPATLQRIVKDSSIDDVVPWMVLYLIVDGVVSVLWVCYQLVALNFFVAVSKDITETFHPSGSVSLESTPSRRRQQIHTNTRLSDGGGGGGDDMPIFGTSAIQPAIPIPDDDVDLKMVTGGKFTTRPAYLDRPAIIVDIGARCIRFGHAGK